MMRWCLSALALLALAAASANVGAAPLDAATCGMLKGEQVKLEHSGVRNSMAKGPDWAKANLAPEKLEQIKRLLQLDEQLLFRCSARTLVDLPPDADADPAAKAPDTDGEKDATPGKEERAEKDKAPSKKAAVPEAKKAPEAKRAGTTSKGSPGSGWPDVPEGTKASGPPPKQAGTGAPARKQAPAKAPDAAPAVEKAAAPTAKPKPKPKVDDAYKPPSSGPSAEPFANQPR